MKGIWLITEDGWRAFSAKLTNLQVSLQAATNQPVLFLEDDWQLNPQQELALREQLGLKVSEDDDDEDRDPRPFEYMVEVTGNVAVMRIEGTLVPTNRWYNRYYDMVSHQEIVSAANDLMEMAEAGTIDTVVLDMRTPGGSVEGINDSSKALDSLGRQVTMVAHASSMMTSGGAWLTANAKRITAERMAIVGSIGVIAVSISYARALEKAGIDATVLRSGEEKALGHPLEPLSAKAKAIKLEMMDAVHDEFRQRIGAGRNLTPAQVAEISTGRSWLALQVAPGPLVDELSTLEQVVARRIAVHNPRSSMPGGYRMADIATLFIEEGTKDMKIKVLNDKGIAAVAAGMSKEDALKDESMFTIEDVALAEGQDAPAAKDEGEDGKKDGEEGEGDGEDEPEANAAAAEGADVDKVAAPAAGMDASLSALMNENKTLVRDNAKLEAKLEGLEAKIVELQEAATLQASSLASMEAIAVEATNRMEIALGNATSSDLKGTALVERYASVKTRFEKAFKVGPQARAVVDEDSLSTKESSVLAHRLGAGVGHIG